MSQKQRSLLKWGMWAFAAVLVVLLTIGTFSDYDIAQTVYSPGNPVIIFISSMGLIPLVYPACLFFGVLAQRSLASQKSKLLRIVGAVLCVVFAAFFGALITRFFISIRDGLGGIFGSELPATARMGIGCVIGLILCAVGFNAGKANDAKDLARRMLILIVVLAGSYILVEILKNLMLRPRPWVLFAGYEGIEFCPWYQSTSGTEELMATYGLEKDAFKSFPSGHSVQAASLLAALYGLSLVYPGLRNKLGIFLAIEIVFALAVMSCRMILGAHFLSDVSTGALVSVLAFQVLLMLLEPQPKQSPQQEEKQ